MKNKPVFLILFLILCFPACYPREVGLDTFIFKAILLNVFFVPGMLILIGPWPDGFARFSFPKLMSFAYSMFAGVFVVIVGSCFLNGMLHVLDFSYGAWEPFQGFQRLGLWTPIVFIFVYATIFFESDIMIAGNKLLGCLVMGTIIGLPGMISTMGWCAIELNEWHIPLKQQLLWAVLIAMAVRIGLYLVGFDYPEPKEERDEQ